MEDSSLKMYISNIDDALSGTLVDSSDGVIANGQLYVQVPSGGGYYLILEGTLEGVLSELTVVRIEMDDGQCTTRNTHYENKGMLKFLSCFQIVSIIDKSE